MTYRVKFTQKAAKSFLKLPTKVQEKISSKLTRLALDPLDPALDIKRLQGSPGGYRLRQGDYRVVYLLMEQELIVQVIRVAHRKEVYRDES